MLTSVPFFLFLSGFVSSGSVFLLRNIPNDLLCSAALLVSFTLTRLCR